MQTTNRRLLLSTFGFCLFTARVSGDHCFVWFLAVYNGTFSTNRLYHAVYRSMKCIM